MQVKHPVAFFEIVSPDVPRAQTFYRDLFGWSVQVDEEGYGLVDTGAGDDAVAGGIGPSMAEGDTGVKIYVRTDTLEDTIARARELGSSVYLEPMELPGGYGRIAVVSDPDGNALGLWA
jgi:predicted enzyme related to lactoylglutathione lyase